MQQYYIVLLFVVVIYLSILMFSKEDIGVKERFTLLMMSVIILLDIFSFELNFYINVGGDDGFKFR